MKIKVLIILLIFVLVIALGGYLFLKPKKEKYGFKDSLSGYSPEEIQKFNSTSEIYRPSSNSKVNSPLYVTGRVPAGWMFEGIVQVKLLDAGRNIIAQSPGKEAHPGTWMDTEPDEFKSTLTFTTSAKSGFLVVSADNPSGLPENDKSYEIPVKF